MKLRFWQDGILPLRSLLTPEASHASLMPLSVVVCDTGAARLPDSLATPPRVFVQFGTRISASAPQASPPCRVFGAGNWSAPCPQPQFLTFYIDLQTTFVFPLDTALALRDRRPQAKTGIIRFPLHTCAVTSRMAPPKLEPWRARAWGRGLPLSSPPI